MLPNDQARNRTRSAQTFVHNYHEGAVTAGLNLNKVSDDFYFVDLASRELVEPGVDIAADRQDLEIRALAQQLRPAAQRCGAKPRASRQLRLESLASTERK